MKNCIKSAVILTTLLLVCFSTLAQAGASQVTAAVPDYEMCSGYVTGLYWINLDALHIHVAVISKDIDGKEKLRCVLLSDPSDDTKKYVEAKDILIASYVTGAKVEVVGTIVTGQTYLGIQLMEPVGVSTPGAALVTPGSNLNNSNELLGMVRQSYNLLKTTIKTSNSKH